MALLNFLQDNEYTLNSLLGDSGGSLDDNEISVDSSEPCSKSLREILEGLSTDVECLVDLTPALDSPAENYTYGEERAIVALNTYLEAHHPFVEQVRNKFPNADIKLTDRLAKRIRDRHLHLLKERGTNETQDEQAVCQLDTRITVSGSNFRDSAIGPSLPATTTYVPTTAPSIISRTPSSHEARFPALTHAAMKGEPFDCVACGKRLRVTSRQRWNDHLMDDLQPYVCVFADCSSVLEDPLCGYRSLRSKWTEHMTTFHPSVNNRQCPLCLINVGMSTELFLRHVSQHLEELALMSLPQEYESDSESDQIPKHQSQTDDGAWPSADWLKWQGWLEEIVVENPLPAYIGDKRSEEGVTVTKSSQYPEPSREELPCLFPNFSMAYKFFRAHFDEQEENCSPFLGEVGGKCTEDRTGLESAVGSGSSES
ncbi:MAG: hypothetical protein M1820_008604 [Bogoriella megaspora]|nr:MAG: hypothetical protein M1820_008604 [Bogoriella megaspora]